MSSRRLVHAINLQQMGFVNGYDVQMRYARYHLDELAGKQRTRGFNVILFVQHNPVYTVGLRDKTYSKETEEDLRSKGAEFVRTNRGGLITFHGPGQLVAYPILNLKHFHIGMRGYVCNLEKTMVDTCASFGLNAKITGDTGVWIEDRKIGAIGIHGSRYITTHGVSLNCNTDMHWFKHIVPCGLEGKEVTSLSSELNQDIGVNEAIPYFLEAFKGRFNCDINAIFLKQDQLCIPTQKNLENAESQYHLTNKSMETEV